MEEMCCIPGHNHEWKDCQQNPKNRNEINNNRNLNNQENYIQDSNDELENNWEIVDREFNMIKEIVSKLDKQNLLNIKEDHPTLFDKYPVKKQNEKVKEANIVNK